MKLIVINGSPRGAKSNSARIVQTWLFPQDSGASYEMLYAKDIVKDESILPASGADAYLIIFPLYVDSVPGIVKGVFEIMERRKAEFLGKKVWYVIHSGFPEPRQSRLAERYMRYFTSFMEMRYMGAAVMGSSEGLQGAPDKMYGKKPELFGRLGQDIREGQPFNEETVLRIAGKETLSGAVIFIMNLLNPGKFFWDRTLKKNGAYDKRYDQPYA